MNMAGNGKTRAAIVSAGCAVLVCGGVVAGWYGGWRTKVERAATRELRIDDHLLAAERGFTRLAAVEAQAATTANKVDNLDENVRTLIESQERTNERLQHLTDLLMDYLKAEAARRPRP